MAPPPTKKQRRLVVLSSDDEAEPEAPTRRDSRHANSRALDSKSKTQRKSLSNVRPIPTRLRAKHAQPVSTSSVGAVQHSPSRIKSRDQQSGHRSPNGKPLDAYFGAADRPYSNGKPPSTATIVPKTSDEEDFIEDDSFEDEMQQLPEAGKLPHHNGGKLITNTNEPAIGGSSILPSGSQVFRLVGRGPGKIDTNSGSTSVPKNDARPWAERFGPTTLGEMAVHKRKVADVREWLQRVFDGRSRKRLLILKGPSGTGKTTTVSLLAKSMDFEVCEWQNPTTMDFSSEGYVSTSSKFEDFLGRGGSFGSLTLGDGNNESMEMGETLVAASSMGPKKRVLLLEEIPNMNSSASTALESFRSAISVHLATSQPQKNHVEPATLSSAHNVPLIIVITETQPSTSTNLHDNFNIHRLLGADILSHPYTDMVEFNPIAPTFLTKALDLVIQKEARYSGRRRVPSRSVLSRLSDVGDIRSAIGVLEFLCVRCEDDENWNGRVAAPGKKGVSSTSRSTSIEMESLEMVTQRESSLGLFHAVGRVVYNKREAAVESSPLTDIPPQPPDHSSQHDRPKTLEIGVEGLIDEIGSDIQTFVATLHENYVLSCEGKGFVDTLGACIDYLSDSDVIIAGRGRTQPKGVGGSLLWRQAADALRQDEISIHVAVRGLFFSLPYPVKRSAHPTGIAGRKGGQGDAHKMFYPMSMRLFGQIQTTEELIDRWSERTQANTIHPWSYDRRSTGVASWGQQVWSNEQPSTPDDGFECETSRRLVLPSKDSIIQDMLPYQTLIERTRPDSAFLKELEDITKFGIDTLAAPRSTSDRGRDTTPFHLQPGGLNNSKSAGLTLSLASGEIPPSGMLGQGAEHLYLSNDDIEDDFGSECYF